MSERPSDWSAVGWERDPVPGDPAVVRQGGRNYIEVADRIKQCAESLRALEAGASTRAQSVTALLEQRDELVDGIWQVEGRYRGAGEALEAYASALDLAQSQSLTALYAARNAQDDLAEARQRSAFYQELAGDYDPGTEEPGAYDSHVRYTRLASQADQDAVAAQGTIDNQAILVAEAVEQRDRAADDAISRIQRATSADGLADGIWENWGARFFEWVEAISAWVASVVGLLALVLCWVPILGQALAALAAIAGVVNALANIVLAIGGERTWREAFMAVGFAALGCVGLSGLRGTVGAFKNLRHFRSALKEAGGLSGAFGLFARNIPAGAREILTTIRHPFKALKQGAGTLRTPKTKPHGAPKTGNRAPKYAKEQPAKSIDQAPKPTTPEEVDDIVNRMKEESTPGRNTKGRTTQFIREGGLRQAEMDFAELTRGHQTTIDISKGPAVQICNISNGPTINLRQVSTQGNVTLEIQYTTKRKIKFRYP
ncbi:hypothetical protein ABYF34_00685 [Buchananella felis]|uniref:hypothetical protein n=1 Tax=Buchananella felis TaxID=3231492 RepID=UPI00352776C1